MIVQLGLSRFNMYPCEVEHSDSGGTYTSFFPTDECVRMEPPRRWRGVWTNDFESSHFCAGATRSCEAEFGKGTWLTIAAPGQPKMYGGVYWIDVVGRRTKYPGMYGHMGGSRYEMIVDKFISMKVLEAPPPEPTKAEMIEFWKDCEAKGSCIPNWDEINKMMD